MRNSVEQFLLAIGALVMGAIIGSGCMEGGRASESRTIKTNYTRFRNAMLSNDLATATNLIALTYRQGLSMERFLATFQEITNASSALTANASVQFKQSDTAYLFPQSKPVVGAFAYRFTRETNGWFLTGESMSVVH